MTDPSDITVTRDLAIDCVVFDPDFDDFDDEPTIIDVRPMTAAEQLSAIAADPEQAPRYRVLSYAERRARAREDVKL